ncbi:MAG: nitrous oxide reductase accessory protein NosL [Flavitalea sp.]
MNNKLSGTNRLLLIVAAIALVIVIFVPIWRIELSAPQYPEGLSLTIHASGLRGNVDIINGLNHYIGMKTLHSEDFIEFTILPYCIIIFAIACVLVGLLGNRRWLNILFSLFVVFGIIAMIDFWKWEFNYGHNLNPDAAIIVPGMAYQPPLIGYKQLLNFGAYSIPDIGGWLFIGVGFILLALVIMEWRTYKKKPMLEEYFKGSVAALFFLSVSACKTSPEPIIVGKDSCSFCKMIVSDPRFGAEIITKKGKVFKYDDTHCLLSFLQEGSFDRSTLKEIYLVDFDNNHSFIKARESFLFKSEELKSPMGGNVSAFSNDSSLKAVMNRHKGTSLHWNELYKP